jgi:hypothetical protein
VKSPIPAAAVKAAAAIHLKGFVMRGGLDDGGGINGSADPGR